MAEIDKIFKAYDVRGIYPDELDEAVAEKTGKALVCFLNCKKVLVGRDMRPSGEKLFEALVRGITSQGADVIDIGLCSTDMFYFGVWKEKADAGVMITASHNPPEYNGLKITKENAGPIGEETGLKEIKSLVAKGELIAGEKQGKIEKKDVLKEFGKFCRGFVNVKKIKPLKVAMDAGNGMASLVAPEVFKGLPIEQERLFFELDGTFPNHEANPLKEENRKDIEAKVKEINADLGIAWDGDADRCFFFDEKGNFVPGDFVVALLAKNTLKRNKGGKIIYDVRCSHFVPKTIEEAGGIPIIHRVGHAFIKKSMNDEKAVFGGELSAHNYYAVNNEFFFDNGFIPALQILEIISEEKKPFSELVTAEGFHHSGEINSEVAEKDAKIAEIEAKYKGSAKNIFHIDGISVEFGDWWFNVRKSNTEPLLRLVLEAKSKELMDEKVKEVLGLIRK